MPKATVLAIHQNAFKPALQSAKNTGSKLLDFMYGTDERVKITYAFALALFILGMSMGHTNSAELAACAAY